MPFLTIEEIKTHLYGEVVEEITRTDDSIVQDAVNAAIEEALGYLTAYDTEAVFNATGTDRNSVLLLYTKDIAVWHFINLSNTAVEMELRLKRYEKAVKWLEGVQSGKINPKLPLPPPPEGDNNFIKWGSIPKRGNYY